MSKQLDEVDLKVKDLLGINPYPNKCKLCGDDRNYNYQLTAFEINIQDGNVHCSGCHKPIALGRINGKCLVGNEFKMANLRRKKNER